MYTCTMEHSSDAGT